MARQCVFEGNIPGKPCSAFIPASFLRPTLLDQGAFHPAMFTALPVFALSGGLLYALGASGITMNDGGITPGLPSRAVPPTQARQK